MWVSVVFDKKFVLVENFASPAPQVPIIFLILLMGLKISEGSDLVELLSLIFTQITTSPTLEAQLHAQVEDRIIEIGLVTSARE